MSYEQKKLQQIVEGALLAAGEALSVDKLLTLFEEHEAPEKGEINEALLAIQQSCEDRGFVLMEVASGWRYQVKEELATWVNRLWEEKPQKYSRALLETLALVAYRQPLTRGDIEEVRGVAVSSHIIKTLTEREWVKVVGHRDVPGRPALYATTRQFLDYFNLKSLDELPSLGELRDIEELNASLDFGSLEEIIAKKDEREDSESSALPEVDEAEVDEADEIGEAPNLQDESDSAEQDQDADSRIELEQDSEIVNEQEEQEPESDLDSESERETKKEVEVDGTNSTN